MCGQAEVGGQGIMACADAAALENDLYHTVQHVEKLKSDLHAMTARAQRAELALQALRRGCLVLSGRACRICTGSWVEIETADDHHSWCPMRDTAERGEVGK